MRSTTPIKEKVWVQHGHAHILEKKKKGHFKYLFFHMSRKLYLVIFEECKKKKER